jgi:thiol-disulfide isomerase/thioredoxin
MLVVVSLSLTAGWAARRLQYLQAQHPSSSETAVAALAAPTKALSQELPVVERSFTPEQQQLASIGFEIVRQPFPAPKLTIEDARGVSRSLSDFQGVWVILEFWGAHCEPCRAAMPALQALSFSGIGEHVQILPVCVDADDAKAAQDIMSQIAPGLPAYVDATGIGIVQFDVEALPLTWLIDPEGQVRATQVGRIDWDSKNLQQTIEMLLARCPKRNGTSRDDAVSK